MNDQIDRLNESVANIESLIIELAEGMPESAAREARRALLNMRAQVALLIVVRREKTKS